MSTTEKNHPHKKEHHDPLPNKETGLLSKKDRQMFMELGFTASSNFLPWEAHALFGQLLLAEPEEAYSRVGLAYCKIMGGQFEDAHDLLKHHSVASSKLKDYGIALRGLAFHLEKKPQKRDALFNSHKDSLQDNAAAFGFFQVLLTS
ncbi:MAG: tetratricopeptide repeat protein [Chthoniobacterales bacterium]